MAAPRQVLEREPIHVVEFVVPELSVVAFFAQRVVESLIAIVALVITAPIMAVIAVIIRSGSRGRALFWQVRVGRNQELFKFVKYRTLFADARNRFPELYRYKYTGEQLRNFRFKIVSDPRVTPQGKWLRKSTLDELPNFWNVLRGDMALVGPRPEIPEMLPYYKGEMQLKFKVRPGITGMAQISGRGRLGFFETVNLDIEYVKKRSFKLDFKILLLTIYRIVTRDGAF
jgi:lipopolysaccharide/colanic/teichoic acid biosynthesis glycosyltransferase